MLGVIFLYDDMVCGFYGYSFFMLSWMFQHDYLDTYCFECLICMCFVFSHLHLFSAIEHVSHGKGALEILLLLLLLLLSSLLLTPSHAFNHIISQVCIRICQAIVSLHHHTICEGQVGLGGRERRLLAVQPVYPGCTTNNRQYHGTDSYGPTL